jgi:DNA-binding PadR family transcriptional regulator
VRDEIEQRTGRSVAPGAVFTAMDRLEGRGLVSSRMGQKQRVRGGKRRRLYRLETEGAAALAAAHREYLSLADGVMPTLVEILQRGGGLH